MEDVYNVVSELSKDAKFLEEMELEPLILDYKPCKGIFFSNSKPK